MIRAMVRSGYPTARLSPIRSRVPSFRITCLLESVTWNTRANRVSNISMTVSWNSFSLISRTMRAAPAYCNNGITMWRYSSDSSNMNKLGLLLLLVSILILLLSITLSMSLMNFWLK